MFFIYLGKGELKGTVPESNNNKKNEQLLFML